MKGKIIFCISFILVLLSIIFVIFWKEKQISEGKPAFFKIEKDKNLRISGSIVEKIDDLEWNLYVVETENQFQIPNSVTMHFSQNIEHLVVVYSDSGNVNGRWIFKKGLHSISLTDTDAVIYISAKKEEEEQLEITLQSDVDEVKGKYSGKYFSVLGDSISSYEGYISDGLYAGYNESYNMSVKDMWWYEMARLTGMNVCEINASAGSGVTDLGEPQFKGNGERCMKLDRPGCLPDVIFVFLGINDFFNQVDYSVFQNEYMEMVSKIKSTYPKAEVFLCTYFELPGEYKAGVDDLNKIIEDISEEQDVKILDLHDSNLSETEPEKRFVDYNWETKDAVHPNGIGQKILGKWAADFLNKDE